MRDKMKINVRVETTEVELAIKKTKRLRRLLKEANSLATELASKDLQLHIKL